MDCSVRSLATEPPPRLILASASPARLRTLADAGITAQVVISAVDEDAFHAPDAITLVAVLARAKAEAVAAGLSGDGDALIVGCDSLLELDGEPMGKPTDPAEATRRWQRMRGRTGLLHTGHHVIRRHGGRDHVAHQVASTQVSFADLSDDEIADYVATGEPLQVAGAFTIDGRGGAFVTGVYGDHHNVVGISLPLLRRLFADLGVSWTALWRD